MFVIANLISAVASLLNWILSALIVVIIVRALLSWVNADPYNGLVRAIQTIAEPFLKPFRRFLPPWRLHGLDLSPLFAVLALGTLRAFLIPTLFQLADRLR